MRSLSTVIFVAVIVGVALADCPKECICEQGSDVCIACNNGYHNTVEDGVFCCSDSCGMCRGTADFCISCPPGLVLVDGDCEDDVFNAEYSSGAGSVPHSSAPASKDEGGLKTWHFILIGVGGAIILAALIIALVCIIRHCVKVNGPSIGVATSQHDVLFDDEDDVDLSPVSKKNKKNVDDDAFI